MRMLASAVAASTSIGGCPARLGGCPARLGGRPLPCPEVVDDREIPPGSESIVATADVLASRRSAGIK